MPARTELALPPTAPPVFALGDIQGCDFELAKLLTRLPEHASIICLGDLVNRGPDSLGVLRRIMRLGQRAKIVLGNHDIYFLACAHGLRQAQPGDTLNALLAAPEREQLIHWLRHQPLAVSHNGFLCVHAGVLPQWDAAQAVAYAREVELHLQGKDYIAFLAQLFTKADSGPPKDWHDRLQGIDRLRFILDALTRLRFCTSRGQIDFSSKDGLTPPLGFLPWFDQPARRTAQTPVVFGHWSSLGLVHRPKLIGLDTGCVWGGKLSAIKLEQEFSERSLIQVAAENKFRLNVDKN
jgi:bis(5'-nucleosyl)-tetraphosphatase (symmetrical)